MTPEKRFETYCLLVGYVYNKEFHEHHSHKEDLIQEGYVALWKCCNNFKEDLGTKFITYAYRAVKNSMIQYTKDQIDQYYNVDSLNKVVCEDYLGGELLLRDILYEEETVDLKYLIQVCLDQMSDKDRDIIEDILCGYTQDSIAVKYGVSQKYVSVRLNKFRTLLKEEMNNG